jgi:hypothetical protein
MMFAGVAPETILQRMGKIHVGKPLAVKNRRELLASLRPNYLKHLRADNGDLPEGMRSCEGVTPGPKPMRVVPGPLSLRVVP